MTDRYLDIVNSPLAPLLGKLGLPKPAALRRDDEPLLPGPVLLVVGPGGEADAKVIADTLLGWDYDVLRHLPDGMKAGAIIVILTGLLAPTEIIEPMLAVGAGIKRMFPGGRVISLSRPAGPGDPPELAAARQGIDGVVRTIGKELRDGDTANGILLAEGVSIDAPSVAGALRFLCSGRSAYVDGQFLTVIHHGGTLPQGDEWSHPLAGKVALVTGAARGIGASIADRLHADGAEIIGLDVPAAGEALAAVANRNNGMALQADITDPGTVDRVIDTAARLGGLDIVIHNAGITRDKLLVNLNEDKWSSVLRVNLLSQLQFNAELLARSGLRPGGRVVCLASTSGIAGNRGQANYAASKAGIIGMVHASAAEFNSHGWTINAVAPGFIETEMTAKIPPLQRQMFRWLSSLQQGGLPRDVASAIAFLASPAAGGINGQILRVCGQNVVGQ